MASAKKKLDEYHLKVLRQLVTQPSNKQCFDCNQRGPTYVNVTIGSFVCTKCSGMLRGLTPPHRVKSISMATFTPEDIDFIKARGNEYCRRKWLGLCDTQPPTKDDQQIKDFMISKYERKSYYLDPALAPTINGNTSNGNISPINKPSTPSVQLKTNSTTSSNRTPAILPPHSLAFKAASTTQVNNINAFTPEPSFNADFSNLANLTPSDPFSSSSQFATTPTPTQQSFANFDNNPAFNNSSAPEVDSFSNTSQTSCSLPQMLFPMLNVPMRAVSAKCNRIPTNRWSIAGVGETGSVPGEDRYAALKDLDSLMKSQQQPPTVETQPPAAPDWNNGVASVWQTTSPFNPLAQSIDNGKTSNPFKGESAWTNGNSLGANPFRNSQPGSEVLWPVSNGQIPNGFPTSQSLNFAPSKLPWGSEAISNPFVVGNSQQQTTGHHSSNPFL